MSLLHVVLLLMREKSREVVKSVIGFIKVAVSALPLPQLTAELPRVVQGLMLWAGESKNRFRLRIRAIFERLVHKFGGDAVLALVRRVAWLRGCRARVSALLYCAAVSTV